MVAVVTPMRPDASVDYEAWSRLIELHLASGTNGIVVGGTTGESATLRDAELGELTQRACEQVGGRIPVIVGAGTSSTAFTVERVRWLSELPVEALLVVTPAYNRPTQEGLYLHFAAVAEAARKPVILYNVPARTAVDMRPETVGRLSQLSAVAGVKEAVPGRERIVELVRVCREGFAILSGDDGTAREAILAGAHGVISVTANVAPRGMAEMVASALRGEQAAAQRLDARLTELHRSLFIEPNPIPVKWALATSGLIAGGIRLPLTPLSAQNQAAVRAALHSAGELGEALGRTRAQ
jgi:4-hydroxy-tetrahydrodipicolinate synthase